MKRKVIQVYEIEGTDLKERIGNVKNGYSETLWCHQVLEREVEKLEKAKAKKEGKHDSN